MENLLHKITALASDVIGHIKFHGNDGMPTTPTRLGDYEIEKELGEGAMAIVYLGKEVKTGQMAAIKTLAMSVTINPEVVVDIKSRFLREAEIAHRLDHPNITKSYGFGEEHGHSYIIFELLHGNDLAYYKKSSTLLPYAETLSIIGRVAGALDYAHQKNVIHRDVKPDNIMYDPAKDVVKLMDFGISKILDESKTLSGVTLGTPYYMSPEQVKGMKIGGASDIYSLGVTLFELLTGTVPFKGDSEYELMKHIVNDPHPDVCEIKPGLPRGISAVIDRSLAKEEGQRFQSGREMVDAIRQCAS